MDNDKKREHRELKRVVKRLGHKHARNQIKRVLGEAPEDAAAHEDSFGRYRSEELNGVDRDATRRKADSRAS